MAPMALNLTLVKGKYNIYKQQRYEYIKHSNAFKDMLAF